MKKLAGIAGVIFFGLFFCLYAYFDAPRLKTCEIKFQSQATQIYAALLRAETKGEKAKDYLLVFKDHSRGYQIRGETAVDALVDYHEKIVKALPDNLAGFLAGRIDSVRLEKKEWCKAKSKLQRRSAIGDICDYLEILDNQEDIYEIKAVKDRLFN
jgi:hypothetical protein